MIISLTGFMGSGKSSVGRKLSTLLCCSFIDLDSAIEESEGRSVKEIFASDGESAFRLMEIETLKSLLSPDTGQESAETRKKNLVIALGGGTIMTDKCADLIRTHTRCIYLRASVETLTDHLRNKAEGRPLLASSDGSDEDALRHRIRNLMNLRSDTYEKNAHIIIDTDGKGIEEISDLIVSKL